MSNPNRYAAPCCVCGRLVPVGEGVFVKAEGVKHAECLRPSTPTRAQEREAAIRRHARERAADYDATHPFAR